MSSPSSSLGLPAIGYLGLAIPVRRALGIGDGDRFVGLAQGAETDVAADLTSRSFGMGHYCFVFSMLMISMGPAASTRIVLLSATLARKRRRLSTRSC